MLWIVFLILVAEIARYWKPLRAGAARAMAGSRSGGSKPGGLRVRSPAPPRGPRRSAVFPMSGSRSVNGSEPAGSPAPTPPTAATSDRTAPATN